MKQVTLIFLTVILFQNCGLNCKDNYIYEPIGLKKLTKQERLDNAKASKTLSPNVVFKNEFGEPLTDDLRAKFNQNNLFGEQYANENGEVVEIIVRDFQSIEEEILLVQENTLIGNTFPFPTLIDVNCEVQKRILADVLEVDQGARTGKHFNQDDKMQQIVISLIEKCGFPTVEKVGKDGMSAIFLVFQYAPPHIMAAYYDQIKNAVDKNDIRASSFALMMDRMLINGGRKQVYGSQILNGELDALRDPYQVNERRAAVGLDSIETYLRHFDLEFEPETAGE